MVCLSTQRLRAIVKMTVSKHLAVRNAAIDPSVVRTCAVLASYGMDGWGGFKR